MNKIITRIFTICLTTALLSHSAIDASSSSQSSNSGSYSSYVNKWTIGGTLAAVGVTVGALWWWKSSRTNQSGTRSRRSSKTSHNLSSSQNMSTSFSAAPSIPTPNSDQLPASAPSSAMTLYQQQTQLTVSQSSQKLMCNAQPVTFAKATQEQSFFGWVFSPVTGKPTPLVFFNTVHAKQHAKVISMIESQADINWQADNGLTAAHIAACNNDCTMMSILTKNRSEPLVEKVLERHGDRHYSIKPADFFLCDNTLNTALHVACQNGNKDMVDIIMNSIPPHQTKRIQLVKKQNSQGYTALHVAAQAGNAHLIESLVAAKGDLNQQTNSGETPLAIAIKHRHANVVVALQSYKGNMNAGNFMHDKDIFAMAQNAAQQNTQNSSATAGQPTHVAQLTNFPGPTITEPQE